MKMLKNQPLLESLAKQKMPPKETITKMTTWGEQYNHYCHNNIHIIDKDNINNHGRKYNNSAHCQNSNNDGKTNN
jgi:hypothetical protein